MQELYRMIQLTSRRSEHGAVGDSVRTFIAKLAADYRGIPHIPFVVTHTSPLPHVIDLHVPCKQTPDIGFTEAENYVVCFALVCLTQWISTRTNNISSKVFWGMGVWVSLSNIENLRRSTEKVPTKI
jgi:hypothetical protein